MRTFTLVVSTCITLCVLSSATHADAPTALDALLALPPSPGVEALLLPHVADPRVPTRWREALTDASAPRRAAAARMLGIAGVRTAVGGLVTAAATEKDPVVLGEMLRALVIVGSESADSVIYTRLSDTPGLPETRIAGALASVRPASVVTHLLGGGALARTSRSVSEIHAMLLRVSPEQATRLERGLSESSDLPKALEGVLHVAHVTARPVHVELLMAGLRGNAATAGEVLAYLPALYGTQEKAGADAALVQAYTQMRDRPLGAADSVHQLLLVMADRWVGRPTASSVVRELSEVPVDVYRGLSLPIEVLTVLTSEERRALATRLGLEGPPREALLKAAGGAQAAPLQGAPAAQTPAHLVSDAPAALVADLRRLTGCRASADDAQAALVTYRADDRPAAITLGALDLSASCQRFLQTLVSVAYGPPQTSGSDRARVVIRLDEDWVACLASSEDVPRRAPAIVVPGRPITPPRKLRDRKPIYPPGAIAARVQGVVVMEATISPTGCVSAVTVTRSIRALDLAAIAAVSNWRYSPTTIDDKAVPVLMTVTVNFLLQ